MEGMEQISLFNGIYSGKTILITGNTGFKGSWLAYWLIKLGAKVVGYSLPPNTEPNHFKLLKLDHKTYYSNICDLDTLKKAVLLEKPDIIFHLAAQPLVRYSYIYPLETYQTNVIGTANVLEVAKSFKEVEAVVIITTDKCYENLEVEKGYSEDDRLGGFDPYSSSKACAELLASSYRMSFFKNSDYQIKHNTLIATARAGNVIGGGDWSIDRLIPDIVKAAANSSEALIRNPFSTRPWQHVLEPLHGYLKLGQKLLEHDALYADAWNFGPEERDVLAVSDVLEIAQQNWNKIRYSFKNTDQSWHEARLLQLNINKAKEKLFWKPMWSNEFSILKTIEWYKTFYSSGEINTTADVDLFTKQILAEGGSS
jgi:CDP-glucose 4,6-dehydratase